MARAEPGSDREGPTPWGYQSTSPHDVCREVVVRHVEVDRVVAVGQRVEADTPALGFDPPHSGKDLEDGGVLGQLPRGRTRP